MSGVPKCSGFKAPQVPVLGCSLEQLFQKCSGSLVHMIVMAKEAGTLSYHWLLGNEHGSDLDILRFGKGCIWHSNLSKL